MSVTLLSLFSLALPSDAYFPPTTPGDDTWETVDPADLGWDPVALEQLDSFLANRNTQGFVILHAGRIAWERYYQGWDLHNTRSIFSVTKSITATQLGRLQADGLLSIEDPVSTYLGLGWTAAAPADELAVTVRDVAEMASGLDESFVKVAEPGTTWFYNTPVYRELLDVIESASGVSRSQYAEATLWTPLGMHDTSYAPNNEFMQSSARDLARFGLMIARGGVWQETDIVRDAEYVTEMLTPSQKLNPAYGLLWWLNGQSSWTLPGGSTGTGSFVPSAPDDLVGALGASEQKVYLVPSLDLVVVRLGGDVLGPQGQFDIDLWEELNAVLGRTSFCDGSDGSTASCPCSNPGLPSSGCDLSQGTGGVSLRLLDRTSSPARRVTWQGAGFPPMSSPTALVIRSGARAPAPVVFGDGLLCIGPNVVRLSASFASSGTSLHTHGHGILPGEFHYQLWYRNTPESFCTPDAFNLSNGRTLTW